MKLTERQRRFCDEYIANKGNATQAAIDAGYSEKTAAVTASENLRKPNIKEYIRERTEEANARLVASGNEVLEFLTEVMRGDDQETGHYAHDGSLTEYTYTDQRNQIKAAELLAKFHGLMTQTVNHEGSVAVTFVDDLPPDDEDEGG